MSRDGTKHSKYTQEQAPVLQKTKGGCCRWNRQILTVSREKTSQKDDQSYFIGYPSKPSMYAMNFG